MGFCGRARRAGAMSGFPVAEEGLDPAFTALTDGLARAAAGQERPVFIAMLGVPGAGKSSLTAALELCMPDLACVSFDRLMAALPDYQILAQEDKAAAFARYELPARMAGYRLLRLLLAKRANLVFDHGGADRRHPELLRFAKAQGYLVAVAAFSTPPDDARRRIAARAGRHTPLAYVDERARLLADLRADYRALADWWHEARGPDYTAEAETLRRTIRGAPPG